MKKSKAMLKLIVRIRENNNNKLKNHKGDQTRPKAKKTKKQRNRMKHQLDHKRSKGVLKKLKKVKGNKYKREVQC